MYNRIAHIIIALVLCLGVAGQAISEQTEALVPSAHEWAFFQKINQARIDPLGMAESIGLDREKILEDFPEYAEILENGVPPLQFNPVLYESASCHTLDMFDKRYYSSISADGRTVEDRMIEVGYFPETAGESLGMLLFINFVQPIEAVDILFENMYRDELDPGYTRERNILNPVFKDVGISIGSGIWAVGGYRYNSYLVTSDFAASSDKLLENEILAVLNQFRDNPKAASSEFLGLDWEQVLAKNPGIEFGMTPVVFDNRILAAAKDHAQDMIENRFFDHVSFDGRTLEDRLEEKGFPFDQAGEIIGSAFADQDASERDIAARILYARLKAELDSEDAGSRILINELFEHIGINYSVSLKDEENLDNAENNNYHLFVADLAKKIEDQSDENSDSVKNQSVVYFAAFLDDNNNNLYDFGEGIGHLPITISTENFDISLFSNEAGTVSIPVTEGNYTIRSQWNGQVFEKKIEADGSNKAVWLRFLPDQSE